MGDLSIVSITSLGTDFAKELGSMLKDKLMVGYEQLTDEDRAIILRNTEAVGVLRIRELAGQDVAGEIAQHETVLASYKSVIASIMVELTPEVEKAFVEKLAKYAAIFGKSVLKSFCPIPLPI